jgi:hypothetical protein
MLCQYGDQESEPVCTRMRLIKYMLMNRIWPQELDNITSLDSSWERPVSIIRFPHY